MTSADIEREVVARLRPLGPRLVMLFGSRATSRATKESDYDLLVVMDVADPDAYRTPPVREALGDLPAAFDIVVYTPQEWAAWKDHPLSFASRIRESGRVLHAA